MNLPNSLTIGRIAAAPFVAILPFVDRWPVRLLAFVLFIAVAVTDYYDGKLARSRNSVTRLGTLLDPLADKLLLLATFIPMFLLVGSSASIALSSPHDRLLVGGLFTPAWRTGSSDVIAFPFLTPFGTVGLPWWILVIVLGRELAMTLFRQTAARRGVVIASSGPAKVKTGFQWTWVGATYFWFFAATLAVHQQWRGDAWLAFAWFNALVVVVSMTGAVALSLYTLWLYVRRHGYLLGRVGSPRDEGTGA